MGYHVTTVGDTSLLIRRVLPSAQRTSICLYNRTVCAFNCTSTAFSMLSHNSQHFYVRLPVRCAQCLLTVAFNTHTPATGYLSGALNQPVYTRPSIQSRIIDNYTRIPFGDNVRSSRTPCPHKHIAAQNHQEV